jgi:hypothetical protein
VAAVALLIICGIAPAPAATPSGDYTQEQATARSCVYNEYCVGCHSSSLQDQPGGALAGTNFAKSLQFSKMSGR